MLYEPREDSELIKRHIKTHARGTVLDMGTGTGILAVEARKFTDKVYAVDIQDVALNHCKKHLNGITVIKSDLFKNIPKIQFDLILFNAPYLPSDPNDPDPSLDGGKKGYELIIKFLKQAKPFLKKDGPILLLCSEFSQPKVIEKEIKKLKYAFSIIDKEGFDFESLYLYKISNI